MRRKSNVTKKDFGHVLVIAGSPQMLGAACLTSLAAMRSGAGMVTAAVPKSLNLSLQIKIAHVVMTFPVAETRQMTFALAAADALLKKIHRYSAVAIGPGLTQNISTIRFAQRIIKECPLPLVVDADALNALSRDTKLLLQARGPRILTPHIDEMARLTKLRPEDIKVHRQTITKNFACEHHCILVLKGHHTIVSSPQGKVYLNTTGNPGMATAGSGDVLTGMISAFLAQGLLPFEAAKWGVRRHGEAGDRATAQHSAVNMIATDIINNFQSL